MRVQKPAGVNFANGSVVFAKVSLGPDAGLATLNFTCPKGPRKNNFTIAV
jgi:hypothetical protein